MVRKSGNPSLLSAKGLLSSGRFCALSGLLHSHGQSAANTELFYFLSHLSFRDTQRAGESELVNESISRIIFNTTRTGNGFNKIIRTGNGFNKISTYILPFKQKKGNTV